MKRNVLVTSAAGAAAAVAIGLGGAAIAAANQSTPSAQTASGPTTGQPSPTASASASPATPPGRGRHDGTGWRRDHLLSGDTAVKVTQAATAQEPTAQLIGVREADDGKYIAVMLRTDGTRIRVLVDGSFAVTSVETVRSPGDGQGGPGMRPHHGRGPSDGTGPGSKSAAPTPSATATS